MARTGSSGKAPSPEFGSGDSSRKGGKKNTALQQNGTKGGEGGSARFNRSARVASLLLSNHENPSAGERWVRPEVEKEGGRVL